VAYRDEHERCPRCGTDLIDAVVGVACAQCQGIWISPASVSQMVADMQVPPFPVQLPLVDDPRESIACPTCREGMLTRKQLDVEIDLCVKHGIWFDARELALVLLRSARKASP
jgi:Zn-finger nucleic acid-binding protein